MKMQFLIQQVWDGSGESAFLINSQVLLWRLTHRPLSEQPKPMVQVPRAGKKQSRDGPLGLAPEPTLIPTKLSTWVTDTSHPGVLSTGPRAGNKCLSPFPIALSSNSKHLCSACCILGTVVNTWGIKYYSWAQGIVI